MDAYGAQSHRKTLWWYLDNLMNLLCEQHSDPNELRGLKCILFVQHVLPWLASIQSSR